MTNIYMKHIYKIIYDLSVYLVTFDLGLPLRSNQGRRPFKGLCLINGASYDQNLYDIHILSPMWPFSLPLTFDEI